MYKKTTASFWWEGKSLCCFLWWENCTIGLWLSPGRKVSFPLAFGADKTVLTTGAVRRALQIVCRMSMPVIVVHPCPWYYRVFGCYEALDGGELSEALEDFTGGKYRSLRSSSMGVGRLNPEQRAVVGTALVWTTKCCSMCSACLILLLCRYRGTHWHGGGELFWPGGETWAAVQRHEERVQEQRPDGRSHSCMFTAACVSLSFDTTFSEMDGLPAPFTEEREHCK